MQLQTNKTLRDAFFLLIAYAILFLPSIQNLIAPSGLLSILYSPQILFLIGSFWIYKKRGLYPHDLGFQKPPYRFFGYAIGLAIACFLAMWILNITLASSGKVENLLQPLSLSGLKLFSLLILAPIAEEVFFRGVLFGSLKRNYSTKVSIIASSLLFMATHQGLFLGTLILGLITATWTHKSKSIYPGMLFHMLSNTFVLFAHNLAPHLGKVKDILFF